MCHKSARAKSFLGLGDPSCKTLLNTIYPIYPQGFFLWSQNFVICIKWVSPVWRMHMHLYIIPFKNFHQQSKGAPFRLPQDHQLFTCLTQAIAEGKCRQVCPLLWCIWVFLSWLSQLVVSSSDCVCQYLLQVRWWKTLTGRASWNRLSVSSTSWLNLLTSCAPGCSSAVLASY